MNLTATASVTSEFQYSASPKHGHFQAVVVYEDDAAFLRAQPICARLARESQDGEFGCLWVAFHGLANAAVAKDAAATAARADLIVFSAHAGRDLPATLTQWIESWLPNRNSEETALAALIGLPSDEEKGITPIHVYLQEVAARGHMDFIPQVIPAPIQDDLRSQENLSRELEMAAFRVFKPTLPPLHWGINE